MLRMDRQNRNRTEQDGIEHHSAAAAFYSVPLLRGILAPQDGIVMAAML